MKTTILIITLVACIALGIVGVEQSRRLKAQSDELSQAKQQLAAIEAELKAKEEAIANAKVIETKAKVLQQTLTESATVAVAQSKKTEELKASLEQEKTNNPLHAVASMFKDPQMREMMKAQQKAYIGPILDKQYAGFLKQLAMSPDQAAAFKDLLGKKMLAGTDVGYAMLDDSLDASQRADLQKQVKDQTDALDNEIKQFLGDDNYKAYEAYEKTVPDRTTLSQFSDQFAGTENALSGAQQEQMIRELSDARSTFDWKSGLNQANAGANGDMKTMFTPENIDRYVAEQERFDQQFLTRAQKILTPAQLASYREYQKAQREMQVLGMKMAGQMFGNQK